MVCDQYLEVVGGGSAVVNCTVWGQRVRDGMYLLS